MLPIQRLYGLCIQYDFDGVGIVTIYDRECFSYVAHGHIVGDQQAATTYDNGKESAPRKSS